MQTFWNLDTSQKRKVCIYGIFLKTNKINNRRSVNKPDYPFIGVIFTKNGRITLFFSVPVIYLLKFQVFLDIF